MVALACAYAFSVGLGSGLLTTLGLAPVVDLGGGKSLPSSAPTLAPVIPDGFAAGGFAGGGAPPGPS